MSFNPDLHPKGHDGRFVPVQRDEAGQVDAFDVEYDIPLSPEVYSMLQDLDAHGYHPMLVGGSVRDFLQGHEPKDLDFEVYGRGDVPLAEVARKHGFTNEVGAAFGVCKLTLSSGEEIDLSVPRRENKAGVGHKGFDVTPDPDMSLEEAAARRDFTINAMSWDYRTQSLHDPHGGLDDLREHRLRHISDAFDEDPLRVLRGVQFAGRMDMTMDPDTAEKCRLLRGEYETLPVERARTEWGKWATKSLAPSRGLEVLHETGWDEVTPGMRGVASSAVAQAQVDAVASAANDTGANRRVMLGATLARHMGDEDATAFLHQSVEGMKEQKTALALSRTQPIVPTDNSIRAHARFSPVSVRYTATLHHGLGEPSQSAIIERAARLGVLDGPEPDFINGEDILALSDEKPGPWMGKLVNEMRVAQARREFSDSDGAKEWVKRRLF